ncbi:hypothetical protein Ddye_012425 [Dipteronia dyeriana]|uniref:RNase H type-1 domain-containing protein n=1 Tax=Dipteronia dyeriana TaxID=168575 RepID=A0AAE0CIM5_9ROSI|nr:hypothetical protein Ddye_012425 [Dipteronia dyeriana]
MESGKGFSIRIFEDRWILRPTTFKILSSPKLNSDDKVACLVSESGGWNVNLINQNFFTEDVEGILSILLGSCQVEDCVLWHFDERGIYSVKSGYNVGHQIKELQVLCVVLWRVWCMRNGFLHEQKRYNVWDHLSWSKAFLSDITPVIHRNSVSVCHEQVKWILPDSGEYKINCKAVINEFGRGYGLVIIIRDFLGLVMASCSVCIVAGVDVWAANALTVPNSIQFGSECCFLPFYIESDAKRAVDGINNSTHLNSNNGSILLDIDRLLLLRKVLSVKWIPAGCNKVANGLTKEACHLSEDNFWLEKVPRIVRLEVEAELHR